MTVRPGSAGPILAAAREIDLHFAVLIQVMAQGGLRPGEVMAVRRQDVSAAGAVHVQGGQRRRGRGPTKNGESRLWPISATRLDRTWKKVLKAAGVSYRKPHALRHSFASILLSRGANPLYMVQAGGWKDANTLFKIYAKWMPWQPTAR